MKSPNLVTLMFFFMFILQNAYALIGTKKLSIPQDTMTFIDSFAFEKNGGYNLSITVHTAMNTSQETILVFVQKGKFCDQIAKQCTFDLLKYKNICKQHDIADIYKTVDAIFPVIIPHQAYIPKNINQKNNTDNDTVFEFNVTEWLKSGYVPSYTVESFIFDYVTPASNLYIKPYIDIDPNYSANNTNYSNNFPKIISNASGFAKDLDFLSFMILSCVNTTIEYFSLQ